MALLMLSFILMALLNVEASYEQKKLNDMIGASVPPYVPVTHRSADDPWIQVERAQLERARLRGLDTNFAQNGYGLLYVIPLTRDMGPKKIPHRSSRPKVPSQTQGSAKQKGFRQCYFNPISCF